jgi:hypothetical protein
MQQENTRKVRRLEVFTGLIIILVSFSYIASILLDFNFVSPYTTLQEDLTYLSEQIHNQRISAGAWFVSAALTLLVIPFLLAVFHRRLRVLQYFCAIFMAGSSLAFIMMWRLEMELYHLVVMMIENGVAQAREEEKLALLKLVNQTQLYRYAGSSCVGIFAIMLGLTRFRLRRFPLFSTGILLLFGPVLVFFNWYDPDHLARTVALSAIVIGVVVFSVRLINRGLSPTGTSPEQEDVGP